MGMSVSKSLLVAALFTSVAASACGGLRRLPFNDGDGGPGGITGTGGGSAGASGRGGASGDAGVSDGPTCVAGGMCVPTNGCRKGQFVCLEGGAMSCAETQEMQANGTECGTNMFCRNGSCETCMAGMA